MRPIVDAEGSYSVVKPDQVVCGGLAWTRTFTNEPADQENHHPGEPADQENHPARGLDGQADHPADETGEPRDQTP